MVGGVADWFAVTALFRHPLGLPIPHTAVIVERKDQFAATLGQFVQENFLNADVLAERHPRRRGSFPGSPPGWPTRTTPPGSPGTPLTWWSRLAEALRDEDVQRVLTAEVTRAADALDVAPLAGRLVRAIIAEGHHAELFNGIVSGADRYLADHYEELRDRFETEAPRWVPDLVVPAGLRPAATPGCASGWRRWPPIPTTRPGRSSKSGSPGCPTACETSPELRERGERIKREVLGSAGLRDWSSALWKNAKETLRIQAADPESELRHRLAGALAAAGRRLGSDPRLQESLERVIESGTQGARRPVPRRARRPGHRDHPALGRRRRRRPSWSCCSAATCSSSASTARWSAPAWPGPARHRHGAGLTRGGVPAWASAGG